MRLGSVVCIKNLALISAKVLVLWVLLGQSAAAVTLTTAAQPPAAVAGTTVVYVTGSGFPGGAISPSSVTVSLAPSCLALTTSATTPPISVRTVVGSTDRVAFVVPSTLATGTYAVWVTGSSPAFTSSTCSTLNVTSTTSKIAACIPSSS